MSRTLILTSRQHRTITAVIEGGVFTKIDNQSGCFFPWVIGFWALTHTLMYW
jgi:hypothetical protein